MSYIITKKFAYIVLAGTMAFAAWLPISRHYMLRAVSEFEYKVLSQIINVDRYTTERRASFSEKIFLHRSISQPDSVENSELSIVEAIRQNYRNIEIDITFTSDGVPFLGHQFVIGSFGRDNEVNINITNTTSDDLDKFRLADGTAPLRLSKFLEKYAYKFDHIVLDFKISKGLEEAASRTVSELLGEDSDRFILISMSGVFLMLLNKNYPGAKIGCECYSPLASYFAGFKVYSQDINRVGPGDNAIARDRGLLRLYWTVRQQSMLDEISSKWGPESIVVNLSRWR